MRTLFILLLTAGLFSSCAAKKRAYIDGGMNYSNLGGKEASSFEAKLGVNVGAGVDVDLCENWALGTGVQFSSQGADYSESVFEGTYRLNYLNVPIIAQYQVTNGLHLEAGPQLGFLLSGEDEFTIEGETTEEDIKDDTKGIDFGLNVGARYTFNNGIYVRARYNFGLTDIIDNDMLSDTGAEWRNNVLQFSVGYTFDLGGSKDDDD